MTEASTPPETFAEFKDSFSYGSRTDLSFNFLKGLPDDAAATFLQELLSKLGAAFNAQLLLMMMLKVIVLF